MLRKKKNNNLILFLISFQEYLSDINFSVIAGSKKKVDLLMEMLVLQNSMIHMELQLIPRDIYLLQMNPIKEFEKSLSMKIIRIIQQHHQYQHQL
jgi:hypothetical protein